MIVYIASACYHFILNSVILFVSGCVSLVAITGLIGGLFYLVSKHYKFYRSEKIASHKTEKKCKSAANLPLSESNQREDVFTENHTFWFVTSNTPNTRIILKEAKKYIKNTVASNDSQYNSAKNEDVREFLEHLIGSLISDKLDDVPVTPLSDDIEYSNLFSKHHAKLSSIITKLYASLYSTVDSDSLSDSIKPSNLYLQLKTIIKEITKDSIVLPPLKEYENTSGPDSIEASIHKQRYEDVLATAVLNKIIWKNQNNVTRIDYTAINSNGTNHIGNRNFASDSCSSPKERLSLTIEEHIEKTKAKYQLSDHEDEPCIDYSANISLIGRHHRAHFPELGKDIVDGYNSYDEDNITEVVSNVDSWEDNWLFQKKKKSKVKNTVSQVAVPMLVPNPSEKYRALIGDVDIDETSDLSECSDSFLEDATDFFTKDKSGSKTNYIYKYDFQSNLETPTLKTSHIDNELENLTIDHDQDSSGVTSISRDISDIYSFSSVSPCQSEDDSIPWAEIREAKNEDVLLTQADSGEGSLETQAESEYLNTECNYSIIIQKKNLPTDNADSSKSSNADSDSSLRELFTPPKPGTIAEREHLKWEKAAPLPNNPYSKENIEKRNLNNFLSRAYLNSYLNNQNEAAENGLDSLTNSTESLPDISRYGRDYYVNTTIKEKSKPANSNEVKSCDTSKKQEVEISENTILENSKLKEKLENRSKTTLVRVSSWSDRKRSDIEIRKRLPSVKELAKQFSAQNNSVEIKKNPVIKNQMVHSLTARSMSREFREGLKNNVTKTYNRNVVVSNRNDKLEEISSKDKNSEKIENLTVLEETI